MKPWIPAMAAAAITLAGCAELPPVAVPTLPALPTLSPWTPKPKPSQTATTKPAATLNAANIDRDLRRSLGLKRWTDACKADPAGWPCIVADVEALSASTLLVTLQTAAEDKRLGQTAWRSINLMLDDHPEVVSLQISNAVGQVLASGIR